MLGLSSMSLDDSQPLSPTSWACAPMSVELSSWRPLSGAWTPKLDKDAESKCSTASSCSESQSSDNEGSEAVVPSLPLSPCAPMGWPQQNAATSYEMDMFLLGQVCSEPASPLSPFPPRRGAWKTQSSLMPEAESPPTREPSVSVGSALHGSGQCRPCAWYWKPSGCSNGSECLHCHSCPASEMKDRRRQKAAAFKRGQLKPANRRR